MSIELEYEDNRFVCSTDIKSLITLVLDAKDANELLAVVSQDARMAVKVHAGIVAFLSTHTVDQLIEAEPLAAGENEFWLEDLMTNHAIH